MTQPSPTLLALLDLARAAGREIMTHHRSGRAAARKADGSPVTEADRRAEAIIRVGLAHIAPQASFIGEESVSDGVRPLPGSLVALVDPLDGTQSFIEGETGEFSVNIALVERGVPIFGALYAPATGEAFLGGPEGAFRGQSDPRADAPMALSPMRVRDPAPGAPLTVMIPRRHGKGVDRFRARIGAHIAAPMASSLKLARLAAGEAQLYPRPSTVSEWDVAAGHAVLLAAGGEIVGIDGAPLRYPHRGPKYLVEGFIAYAGAAGEAATRGALMPQAA